MLNYILRKLGLERIPKNPVPTLIHEIENSHHRLTYKDHPDEGEWVSIDEIARLDQYAAITGNLAHGHPSVFEIKEVDNFIRFYLDHDTDNYWGSSK